MTAAWTSWLCRRNTLLGLSLLPLAGLLVCPQESRQTADDAKLNTKVHLSLGSTTLLRVMDELSKQTGLKIEASDYLLERKLIVAMEGLTSREALDSLAELNDWTWYRTESGHYLLARPTFRRPSSLRDVPRAMQAALPRDFRVFLGGMADWRKMTPDERAMAALSKPHLRALNQTKEAFVEELAPSLLQQDVKPYSTLSGRQQESLLFSVVFDRFGDTSELLYDFGLHQIEPALVTLELQQGKILMVEMYRDPNDPGSGVGFGQNVVDR
jgi:hypothetical protein